MIEIDKHTNQILNIVKAKYGLKTKSEAIEEMAREYEQEVIEPELRPEFIARLREIERTAKFVKVKNVDEYFKKMLEG